MPSIGKWAPAGLALGVSLSALLRTVGHGIEYSLIPAGSWTGWLFGLLLGLCLAMAGFQPETEAMHKGGRRTLPILGIYFVLTLVYFSFSAPAVIARWTEGNYTLIVAAVSLFSIAWAWILTSQYRILNKVTPRILLAWNLLFTLCLTLTLLAQRVSFPPTLDSPPVVVGALTILQMIPLGLMLVLFPVVARSRDRVPKGLRNLMPKPGDGKDSKTYGLTPRELEMVAAIVSGCTNKEIAQRYSLSEQTVKHHLTSIFDKLGVSTRLELALFACSFVA